MCDQDSERSHAWATPHRAVVELIARNGSRVRSRDPPPMRYLFFALLLALVSIRGVPAQQPQLPRSPSTTMGGLVAERMCAYCHRVSPRRDSEIEAGAPSFMEIANRPGRDADFLRAFASETHIVTSAGDPPMAMSTIVLTPMSREDVIAYILSLKSP
jgi:hypothetical protein